VGFLEKGGLVPLPGGRGVWSGCPDRGIPVSRTPRPRDGDRAPPRGVDVKHPSAGCPGSRTWLLRTPRGPPGPRPVPRPPYGRGHPGPGPRDPGSRRGLGPWSPRSPDPGDRSPEPRLAPPPPGEGPGGVVLHQPLAAGPCAGSRGTGTAKPPRRPFWGRPALEGTRGMMEGLQYRVDITRRLHIVLPCSSKCTYDSYTKPLLASARASGGALLKKGILPSPLWGLPLPGSRGGLGPRRGQGPAARG